LLKDSQSVSLQLKSNHHHYH